MIILTYPEITNLLLCGIWKHQILAYQLSPGSDERSLTWNVSFVYLSIDATHLLNICSIFWFYSHDKYILKTAA